VLRNKSLVILSVLVLVLAVVAMACAPAAPVKPVTPPVTTPITPPVTPPPPPVTPPAVTGNVTVPAVPPAPPVVEKVTTFKAVKFTDPTYKFTVSYPEGWTSAPATVKGGLFYAKGTGKDIVYIAVRPATDFKAAANTFLGDLIAASGAAFSPSVDSETTVTLADGTKANVILLSAAFGMAKAAVTGVLKDGNAIMIVGGTDPKSMELYKEIGSTLIAK